MPKHEGGCLCGRIRYSFRGAPALTGICHCRNCQQQSGAPFSLVCGVASDQFQCSGDPVVFDDRGDSGGGVRRHFCPRCGSSLFSLADSLPGLTLIKAGTLDDPGRWTPGFEVYCDRALPWLPALTPDRHARNAGEEG